MAVKVTVVSGAERILPTAEEIGVKVDDTLRYVKEHYASIDHISEKAGHDILGHVKLEGINTPKPLGTASVGEDKERAARADHVHQMPTPAEVGAAPASHTEVKAGASVIGHV